MKATDYLYQKQLLWAKEKNLELEPAKDGSDKQYVKQSEDNFFPQERLSEIISDYPPMERDEHMRALISSSALVVNVFDFWRIDSLEKRPSEKHPSQKVLDLVQTCFVLPDAAVSPMEMRFEAVFPIKTDSGHAKTGSQPHLDVVFECKGRADVPTFAVKSKFTEPYTTSSFKPFSDQYFDPAFDGLWSDLKELRKFAKEQRHQNFKRFDAAQLVKCMLGLKAGAGESGAKDFHLVYLWYEESGKHDEYRKEIEEHRQEIEDFTTIAKEDGIAFHAMTYQKLLKELYSKYGKVVEYKEYFDYVMERYYF